MIPTYSNNTPYFNHTKKFCLLLYITPDPILQSFIQYCKSIIAPSSNLNKCFYPPHTEHITLFANKRLTYDEVMSISTTMTTTSDSNSSSSRSRSSSTIVPLPIVSFNGFTPWSKHGLYLSTNVDLNYLTSYITCSFQYNIQNHLHFTLYNNRPDICHHEISEYYIQKLKNEIKMKKDIYNLMIKGTAKGTMIVVKEMGKDYFGNDGSFFRVIYKEPCS